jgi:DNA-binding protein YbaB
MSQNTLSNLNLEGLLQKAREAQSKLQKAQARLAHACVVGNAGNQDVQIKITGKYNVVSTAISDQAYANKEKLEQLITIAINDAMYQLALIAENNKD